MANCVSVANMPGPLTTIMLHAGQRGKQHWITAFPQVEAWILAKPVSSEISSQAGEGDFDDDILVDTPKQHKGQVLVVQAQNGANMATSSTTITAQSTAASTAALQVAGPSTEEPIVEQLGQDTPSVIQGAHPEQRYDSQPYFSGQQPYNAATQPYTAPAQPYIAPYNNMPALSARPTEPMGYFGQGGQLPFMLTEEQLLQQQQLLREKQEFDAWRASRAQAKTQSQPQIFSEAGVNVEVDVDSSVRSASVLELDLKTKSLRNLRLNVQGLPLPRGTTLGGLARSLGHLRPVPGRLSIRLHLLRTLKPLRLS